MGDPAETPRHLRLMDHSCPDANDTPRSWAVPLDYGAIKALWTAKVVQMHHDNARYAKIQLGRARLQQQRAASRAVARRNELLQSSPRRHRGRATWYESLPPLKADPKRPSDAFQFSVKSVPALKTAKSAMVKVNLTPFDPQAIDIPHFKACYPISQSQIMPSDMELLNWPEAAEDVSAGEEDVKKQLEGRYHFRMATRSCEVAYIQRGRQLQEYAEAFLEELGLTERLMLRYLLDDTWDESVRAVLSNLCDTDGISPLDLVSDLRRDLKDAPQYKDLKSRINDIAPLDPADNRPAETIFAYLAIAHHSIVGEVSLPFGKFPCLGFSLPFSITYMLSKSESLDMAGLLRPKPDFTPVRYGAATHFDLACRICHTYPCYTHGVGSIWDYLPPANDSEDDCSYHDDLADDYKSESEAGSDDRDLPRPLLDCLEAHHHQQQGTRAVRRSQVKTDKDMEFNEKKLWGNPNKSKKRARVFFPCNHLGGCSKGVCRCAHTFCEKSCGCPEGCPRRFRGCNCAQQGRACTTTKGCPCRKNERECDPDLCGTCGVFEVLDPQNSDKLADKQWRGDRCQNLNIQLGLPKIIRLGESPLHGFGSFAGESIERGDFIGEYIGAKLTWQEAERAGVHALLSKYSYLFDLTGDQTVDSMIVGNKVRYINNSKQPNCVPRTFMCNTEYRMAMFATRDIAPGEELLFDYGGNFQTDDNGLTTKPTKPAARKQVKRPRAEMVSPFGPRLPATLQQQGGIADDQTTRRRKASRMSITALSAIVSSRRAGAIAPDPFVEFEFADDEEYEGDDHGLSSAFIDDSEGMSESDGVSLSLSLCEGDGGEAWADETYDEAEDAGNEVKGSIFSSSLASDSHYKKRRL